MKYIIAIIQPHKLTDVMGALERANIPLITVTSVLGRGRQKGIAQTYRGTREIGSLLQKVKLEIAVNEDFVAPAIDAITSSAQTGEIGDGKIFVLDLQEVLRIRTGETGSEAIG